MNLSRLKNRKQICSASTNPCCACWGSRAQIYNEELLPNSQCILISPKFSLNTERDRDRLKFSSRMLLPDTPKEKRLNFSGWYSFMTERNKFASGMIGTAGKWVSFVSNHHVKTDLGVSIQISTIIKRLGNPSFPLHHLKSCLHFALGLSWSWNSQYWIRFLPKARACFLYHLYSISENHKWFGLGRTLKLMWFSFHWKVPGPLVTLF